jgi:hypothetical protein
VSVYTAVLFTNTAIPVWHRARREMPYLFASSAAASAGGAALTVLQRGGSDAVSAATLRGLRRMTLGAAVAELGVERMMERRLGEEVGAPFKAGRSGAWAKAAAGATSLGTVLLITGRRAPKLSRLGPPCIVMGSLFLRFSVFTAGFASAREPGVAGH